MTSIVLAGGGTAGHTSPLLATAEQLLDAGATLTCVGTPRGLENRVIPAAGLPLRLIPAVPLPRKPGLELAKVPWRLSGAVRVAKKILRETNAEVAVGFGGYVSLPVYFAARALRIPVVIHEQNALPGLANRGAARFAAAVLVSFPNTPLPRAQVTGLPIRAGLAELAKQGRAAFRTAGAAAFGLDPNLPTLLVSGGSQGARSINTALLAARAELLDAGIQILHVLGPQNMTAETVPLTSAAGVRYLPVAYVDRMEDAYASADLMLGRAGAATVVETASIGLPAVYVPYPVGNGEQERNAAPVVAAGAGVLLKDADLTAARLLAEVLPLLRDPARLATMANAGRTLLPSAAAERVAAVVLGLVGSDGRRA
ncbi:MAG: undecaprenyldiphospho-muramoylpentapeptide beta-N-acetylglucosaminyltransferase [Propionibacteriaceae bacterium]|jgi:UDP-N-acetylglucosamine--N-acetylmuramyl-(pentapeptide) pyrophosphoryl-undecaprenol N-acetylglucosamine transferase|nr:undecaprenyldiphospho-muramoylpentapeptide beta-N-acetylglucosaminyltransferase [Propionibacteriaceae bacterium]